MTSEFCNGLWFDMKQRFLQSNEGSLTVFVLYARHEIWRFSVANAQRIKDVVRIVQDSKKELVVCSAQGVTDLWLIRQNVQDERMNPIWNNFVK